MKKFSLLITTRNRKEDLAITLKNLKIMLQEDEVDFIICDDGSVDGTSVFLETEYPEFQLITNTKSKGLIYSRNRLLSLVKTEYAISLDDDANFLTENPLNTIVTYFNNNPKCGLIALRIFWGISPPTSFLSKHLPVRVRSFVGCAHVWRMSAWRAIPDYPEWFFFYGEEDFAAFQLFKKNVEIHYLPEVLVQHRVDVRARAQHKDYRIRNRRSLRSGWYLYLMFYPFKKIPKIVAYSIWSQIKTKVAKGDLLTIFTIFGATFDVFLNSVHVFRNSNRLSPKEFDEFSKLPQAKIYWKPEGENKNVE